METLPESLKHFLWVIICGKDKNIKTATIGQCIAQAARPRSALFPLQFDVAMHAHGTYGSCCLVDILYKLGFGSSYSMAIQFETSAALAYDTSTSDYGTSEEGQLQFVADNMVWPVLGRDFNRFDDWTGPGEKFEN